MSALELGAPEVAARLCHFNAQRLKTHWPASSSGVPIARQTPYKLHKDYCLKKRDQLHLFSRRSPVERQSRSEKAYVQDLRACVSFRFHHGARSRALVRRQVRANANDSNEARSQPEDELTLRNRLNAISHRRPVPSLNGTAAPSMGFGSSPAAEPSDPSLSKQNLRYRAFSEPVQPPPVIKASDRPDVVGVLGGISPQATANFMRQVIQATPATANKDHVPLIVSSIPQIPSLSAPILNRPAGPASDEAVVSPLPALLETRRFLEQAGAQCIVMPSNMAHFWYDQLAQDCSVPFLHIADAVAEELDLANLEPLEAGSRPKIGLLANEATLKACIYQQKLEARGYTVVLPDRDTMAHAVLPGMEAVERGDNEGAKNLLGIGIQVLLVNAANVVILAFSEASSVFTPSDPILKRCLSPTAALSRATVRWVLKTRAEAAPKA